jgi:hypothetical protein
MRDVLLWIAVGLFVIEASTVWVLFLLERRDRRKSRDLTGLLHQALDAAFFSPSQGDAEAVADHLADLGVRLVFDPSCSDLMRREES